MARRRSATTTLVRSATPTVRIAVPRAAPMTRVRAAGKAARRVGRRLAASSAMTPIAAAVTSAGIGFAEKSGFLDKVPTIPVVGRKGTLAVLAWAWGKFAGGGKIARDVCVVSAALAGYEYGKLGSVTGEDYEESY